MFPHLDVSPESDARSGGEVTARIWLSILDTVGRTVQAGIDKVFMFSLQCGQEVVFSKHFYILRECMLFFQ